MKERIEIYTEGHCSGNPGPGGWGFVAIQGGRVVEEASETAADTTNNRMEMLAVIRTVEWLNSRRGNPFRRWQSLSTIGSEL